MSNKNKQKEQPQEARLPIATNGITDLITNTSLIADQCNSLWNATWDIKAAQTALSAFKTAVSAAKTQLIYKKLTCKPEEIPFLEK